MTANISSLLGGWDCPHPELSCNQLRRQQKSRSFKVQTDQTRRAVCGRSVFSVFAKFNSCTDIYLQLFIQHGVPPAQCPPHKVVSVMCNVGRLSWTTTSKALKQATACSYLHLRLDILVLLGLDSFVSADALQPL